MNRQTDEQQDRWMGEQMDRSIEGWKGRRMEGRIRMDGRTDGWTDGEAFQHYLWINSSEWASGLGIFGIHAQVQRTDGAVAVVVAVVVVDAIVVASGQAGGDGGWSLESQSFEWDASGNVVRPELPSTLKNVLSPTLRQSKLDCLSREY